MEEEALEMARRWLADRGVNQVRDGWVSQDEPDALLTANEVAQSWAGDVFAENLDAADQLRLAFELLDLLDDYWVTCEIRFAHESAAGPLPAELLWDGHRRRLEADGDVEAVSYSLWVDWFQDHVTSATAFAEVLGNDIDRVVADRSKARLRRARRVLECSGPVRWPVKEPVYRTAMRLPSLHGAVFKGLLTSFHDVYGDLEPAAALPLLDQLDLPTNTQHLAELRHVLTAGHRNHHRCPHAWEDAVQARLPWEARPTNTVGGLPAERTRRRGRVRGRGESPSGAGVQ
ncbi:hypothetical protein ACIP2X_06655 [Streptomyces sp. NPDC089424]|uniref:hypothetical protein n=1 Tax=Streptomyces sp. NPDC089424 TaxID=3365917 RepID=UPI003814B55D